MIKSTNFNLTSPARSAKTARQLVQTVGRLRHLTFAALITMLPMTSVSAQQAVATGGVYISGAERIDLGDRIRMQSQRISAMACMMDAGHNVEGNRAAILEAITQVDAMLIALAEGDAEMNITVPEDNLRMLEAIRGVSLQWDGFRDAINLRMTPGVEADGPDYVSRQNLNLMHASKYLISETANRYAIPPALLQSDAFTIKIAVRQRSLAQQLAKESCALMTGNNVMGSRTRLQKVTQRFDASFNALVNGFAPAGVSAPATEEIRSGLTAMTADWTALRATLDRLDDEPATVDTKEVFDTLDKILVQYDQLVPLYIAESKSGLQ